MPSCPSPVASASFFHQSNLLTQQYNLASPPHSHSTLTQYILDKQNIMAACDSLSQHIFENSLPQNPSLLDSISPWNQIKPINSTFIDMFGELHIKESSSSPSSSSSPPPPMSSSSSFLDINPHPHGDKTPNLYEGNNKSSSSLNLFANTSNIKYTSCPLMNSESLQLCTEGLGSESSDDVEDLKSEISKDWQTQQESISIAKHSPTQNLCGDFRRSRTCGGSFPPPISCIGKCGKPWVCFKSYRHDGRFVLKEIRMPSKEFLHACREDGRLKLQFIQPNDDILELEEEDSEDVEVDEEEDNENFNDAEEDKRRKQVEDDS
ncbi:protein FANTASTIC FOUR 3-like [Mangifera indica]|uniref:protein FANTASTIC FOUR 3-like n=1 Tax=Mangifera indica TaxID=29780 RepID=UPI001CFB03FF|nr:protein FANTASTIC FOUR 3-like [Mangifera indica]